MAHAVRRLLLEANLVTEDQLRRIEGWYDLLDRSLVEKCYRSSLISDDELLRILVDQGAVDASQTLADAPPVDAALGALSRELAERHRALPLSVSPNEVVIGMLDPFDNLALKQIRAFAFLPVKAVAVRASLLFPALTKAYGVEEISPVDDPAQFLSDEVPEEKQPKLERFAPAPVEVAGNNRAATTGATEGAPSPAAPAPKTPSSDTPSSATSPAKPADAESSATPSAEESADTTSELTVKHLADTAFPSDDDEPAVEAPSAPSPPPVDAENASPPLPPPGQPLPSTPSEKTPAPVEALSPPEPAVDVPAPATPVATDSAPKEAAPAKPAWKPDVSTAAFSASNAPAPTKTFDTFEAFRDATFSALVPPFRTAILLGITDLVARGWAGRGRKLDAESARRLEVPLDAPSAFRRAWEWSMVAAGSKLEPSRAERLLFNAIDDDAPSTFAVFPIKFEDGAEHPQALLYVDVAEGLLNEDSISIARQHAESMVSVLAAFHRDDKLPK